MAFFVVELRQAGRRNFKKFVTSRTKEGGHAAYICVSGKRKDKTRQMDKDRIRTAVDFLKDGQSFKLGDLTLGITDNGDVYVTGWTQYINIENLTRDIALYELKEIKELFERMTHHSPELKRFTVDRVVKYNLAYDDSGKVGIGICEEVNGKLTWIMDLKK